MTERESGTNIAVELLGLMDPQGKIDTCMEWSRVKFRALCFSLALAGYGQARVICGRRTFDEQVRLFGQGRNAAEMESYNLPGTEGRPLEPRVSWLAPRHSQHVKGLAIDFDFSPYEDFLEGSIEDVCRQLGVTWGGVWSVRDYAHFEI